MCTIIMFFSCISINSSTWYVCEHLAEQNLQCRGSTRHCMKQEHLTFCCWKCVIFSKSLSKRALSTTKAFVIILEKNCNTNSLNSFTISIYAFASKYTVCRGCRTNESSTSKNVQYFWCCCHYVHLNSVYKRSRTRVPHRCEYLFDARKQWN